MKFIKVFIIALTFSLSLSISSYANQSVEEIIKGRKAMFSENYQNAKQISILLKQKKIEEAKPLMKKISNNYKKKYFPPKTFVEKLHKKFTPYCSVATWYLWRSIDNEPIQY